MAHSGVELPSEGIDLTDVDTAQEQSLLEEAFIKMNLSARAYHRILKVARTIADLSESEKITTKHISEAICYRSMDQKYWE